MIRGKMLCLNMIVRNEMVNLERCLNALADQIDCWVIGDTGSIDGTQDFIKSFFAERMKPGELHSFPFENFEQARNAALDCAYGSRLDYDYLLLADADMELVVDDPAFRERLQEPGYQLLQRAASGLAYWNTRLIRPNSGARYHGVTHEYIDVPGGVKPLEGVWFKDHASGSNRVDKFERDIKLLSVALERDPGNHRYWFYLAQSYRDAGRVADAVKAYAKRVELGGWEEETWNARLQEARCLLALGDEGGFLRQALAAFNMRPQRAEPLYDLARFYREKGMNDASVLFSESGLAIERPKEDILFLEDFVYAAGLQEEYSIAANYIRDPMRKDRGFAACNWLALNRDIPPGTRGLARHNLRFYVQPAVKLLPTIAAQPVGFTPPEGWHAMNPSVARRGDAIVMVQPLAKLVSQDGNYRAQDDGPVETRNFLLRLDASLAVQSSVEILPPADLPPLRFGSPPVFEDMQLFAWQDALWCIALARELTPGGCRQQLLACVDESGTGPYRLVDWCVIKPTERRWDEKNCMPLVVQDELRFICLCDPTRLVDEMARTVGESIPPIAAEEFRGGSQATPFDGGWLGLVHEVGSSGSDDKQRLCHHRFVWLDAAQALRGVSRPFIFERPGIEFARGLAWHPDGRRLIISYGVGDGTARLAIVNADDVRAALDDATRLPSGMSTTERVKPPWHKEQPVAASRDPISEGRTNAAERCGTAAVLPWSRKLRFHILGVPHTASNKQWVADAFTQKVVKLCRMLNERGHTVIHYGHEASDVVCDEHVTVTTDDDLARAYSPDGSAIQLFEKWKTSGFGFHWNISDHAYQTFFRNAIAEIDKRKAQRDFLLCMMGFGHKPVADAHGDMIVVEPGIGYGTSYGQFAPFKVFESYAVLHASCGVAAVEQANNLNNYSVVIPNFFNPDEFEFSKEKDDYFLYLGRIILAKGVHIALQVSDRIGTRLIVAGQGSLADIGYSEVPANVEFVGHADFETRTRLLSRAKGLFLPTGYIEPFGGVQIEALLSGTPTITTDWGALAENNLHGITGYRCRTFDHFVWAARNIGRIDPYTCRRWAEDNFSVERVGEMYEEFFQSVMDVYTGQGWYELHPNRINLNWLAKRFPNGKP